MNLVDLRFLSEHAKVPANEVIKLRSGGRSFTVIHAGVTRGRGKQAGQGKTHEKGGEKKGKGKGHEKGEK